MLSNDMVFYKVYDVEFLTFVTQVGCGVPWSDDLFTDHEKWWLTIFCFYLACEHIMVFGVKLPNDELFIRAREPMHKLCMGFRHLHMEDLCDEIKELQMVDMNRSKTTPSIWILFIGARQLSMNRWIELELDGCI